MRSDAEIGRASLSSVGIDAIVRADDEGGLNPGFFSDFRVALVVRSADVAEARQQLGLPERWVMPRQIADAIIAHSRWAYPDEACGLLAGSETTFRLVVCLTNRAASPDRYVIDPREHFGALRFAEAMGYEIVGAWHSHPHGPPSMSPTDIDESPGGDWVTVIVGRGRRGIAIGAYRAQHGTAVEIPLDIVESLP